ncbi:MAG TPA: hypothetical protein VIJ43_09915, partial [Burkholderiales bacterium]
TAGGLGAYMPSPAKSDHCALRAPAVFSVRMKSASVQKTRLWIKAKGGLGWLLYKIADCARMCFSSVHNRRSARTGRHPRKCGEFFVRATW